MREAVGGLELETCSVDRGRGAHVRIWGVTGPRKWLHLFNSCCIFFFTRSPVICVKDMSPPVRPSRGGGRPFSVECCPLRLAALGRPSQMTNVQDGESELLSPQNLSPNYHSLATNGNHQQGGFASFSAAGGILGGALPDPGKSQSFLDNLTFSRLTGGLQPKLVSAGWVLGLGRNCPPVAAALTHWARTRGLWQRSHHWRPQRPTTTHPPPRRCSAGAQHPCPRGNPRKWVGIEHKPTPLEKQS